jgi:hypothetical protein
MSSVSRSVGDIARVYALTDPRTGEVRYIGMTVRTLKARLRDHLRDLRREDHRTRWIRSLIADGVRPEIKELEVVRVGEREAAEQRWVSFYRVQGARLVNSTKGGAGTLGYKRSAEDRQRIGERSRLLFQQPGRWEAVSLTHRGKVLSEAHKAAVGAAAAKKWADYRASGGAFLSEESRERIRAAAKARSPRQWSDESKAKLGATKKRSDIPDDLIVRLRDELGLGWTAIGRQVSMSDTGVRQRYDRIKKAEAQVADEDLPEVKFAEHPQRSCRAHQTPDGLIDHFCSLPELHPGPHCPRTLPDAISRRQEWERGNPGWEQMHRDADPFADFTKIPGVV